MILSSFLMSALVLTTPQLSPVAVQEQAVERHEVFFEVGDLTGADELKELRSAILDEALPLSVRRATLDRYSELLTSNSVSVEAEELQLLCLDGHAVACQELGVAVESRSAHRQRKSLVEDRATQFLQLVCAGEIADFEEDLMALYCLFLHCDRRQLRRGEDQRRHEKAREDHCARGRRTSREPTRTPPSTVHPRGAAGRTRRISGLEGRSSWTSTRNE